MVVEVVMCVLLMFFIFFTVGLLVRFGGWGLMGRGLNWLSSGFGDIPEVKLLLLFDSTIKTTKKCDWISPLSATQLGNAVRKLVRILN